MPQLFHSKKTVTIIAISAATIVAIIVTVIIYANTRPTSQSGSASAPTFEAILPQSKTIETLGGWQKLTPPNSDPYFIFADTIGSVNVTVSQQVLPEAFKVNTAQSIQQLAKGYSATEELEVGEIKAFIGTSVKGPQSVIFTKSGLLILIKSQAKVENSAWMTYIQALGLKNTPRY